MLARFPNEIPNRNFRTVVLLGGTNDTLLGIDPSTTIANLSRMVDLARAANVEPLLAEIPPIYKQSGRYLAAVQRLNSAITALARAKNVKQIDYYDALLNHQSSYSDGTHLKRRGYLRMELALVETQNPF
jgi:lysophospholipase L1-like esterase